MKIVAQYAIKNADKTLGGLKNGLQVKKYKKYFKTISNDQAMGRLGYNIVYSLVKRFQKRYHKGLEGFNTK